MRLDVTAVADTLDRAADELDERGWVKFTLGQDDSPKCLLGALRYAVYGAIHPVTETLTDRKLLCWRDCAQVVSSQLNVDDFAYWNDFVAEPGQAQDELRFAAKRLRDGDLLLEVDP